MNRTLAVAALLVATACTTVDYTSRSFPERSADHQIVAILPFEMVFAGKAPAELTEEQVASIEEGESLTFQTALYHSMLNRSSAGRKHPILIEIQPVDVTNRTLERYGIGIRESWSIPAEELARILGVDAVVRTTVQKTRYLTDLESFGIDLGSAVLIEVSEGRLAGVVPYAAITTVDIWADSTLIDGSDGGVLWKVALERATDWRAPANDVVLGITRMLAKKFPYRA